MNKKIYFKGYYGFKNLGDDIFCVTADWVCNNLWENVTPIFIGNNLPLVSKQAKKYQTNNSFLKKMYELVTCFKVNYIIYLGGSVLSKISGIKDIKYHLSKYNFFNSKLGTIGTSIGPFKNENDYHAIKKLLKKFKFITVRDYSSLSIMEGMELETRPTFSFDTAILIDEVFPSLKTKKKKASNNIKIAVSLCHYERYKGKDITAEFERENAIMNFLDGVIEKYDNIGEIIFFQFNGNETNGDLEITEEFHNRIKDKVASRIVKYSTETEKFCKELNESDFLIGIRLHSGILAYALNIPFILAEYHPKCTEFLNTINNNYRFDTKNDQKNLELFESIINKGCLSNIKAPDYFKNILLEELKSIGEIL
ncbi:polysaccharide pyruvyl transferase family protein [Paenibacillus sp. LjRoot56]|uniref:polysaccharide pyruvyl transferase family protein n=1 Tax=Paenibacillus sp. LjRoot56 TaxID=3342333 RepID=UPI003ECC7B5B